MKRIFPRSRTKVIPIINKEDESSEEEALLSKSSSRILKENPQKVFLNKAFKRIGLCCCGFLNSTLKTFYRIWFFIVFFYTLYYLVMIPFKICFFEEEYIAWTIVEGCFDVILLIDIIFSMCSPYHRNYSRNKYPRCCGCFSHRKCSFIRFFLPRTCFHYMSKNFYYDAFVIFPFYFFTPLVNYIIFKQYPTSDFEIQSSWLKINRILLVLRVPNFFSHLRDFISKVTIIRLNPDISKVAMFLIMVALIAHYIACFFYFVVRFENSTDAVEFAMSNQILVEGQTLFKYSTSMYWSLVTMTGYGGTLPITDVETVFSIFVVFVGVLVYVTVIGIVGSMITNLDTAATAYRDKVDTINDYMKFRKLEKNTRNHIRKYYHYLWSTRKGMDETKIMFNLPEFLRLEVSRCLNKDMLRSFHFFQDSSEGFIRGILVRLVPKTVYPGSYIIKEGEIGKEMFFLTKGTVDIFVKVVSDFKPVATLSAIQYFGEAALLTGNKRNASIVARDFCDMFILKLKDFDEICSCYREERDRIWNIHCERTRKTEKEKEEKLKKENELAKEKERLRKENERRRFKIEEERRIENLKIQRQGVYDRRKIKKRRKWRERMRLFNQRKFGAGGSLRAKKNKDEIFAMTKEIM